jgi:hypothetical protein
MSFPCDLCRTVSKSELGLRIHWGKRHAARPDAERERVLQLAREQNLSYTVELRRDYTVTTPEPKSAPEWSDFGYLVANNFDKLAARRILLSEQRDAISRELDQLNLELGVMLATASVQTVRFGFHRLQLRYGHVGGKLSKTRLLELGVTPDQIQQATSPREQGNPYVLVAKIGDSDDDTGSDPIPG